jgi:hypothetical protein
MKSIAWRLSLTAALAALAWSGSTAAVFAAEPDRGGPGERIERLEQRVNEMAQRQEQLLRRLGAQQERQGPAGAPGREGIRQRGPFPGLRDMPRPQQGAVPAAPPAPPVSTGPKAGKEIADLIKLCFFVGFIFNILIAIWIFSDIRKRGEGSGIFVALALLAGIPTAIIYAIVRIGDKKT